MSDKIRILYIVPSLRLCNGVASYAMNYFRNIDKNKFHIDFITGANEESVYYDEIKNAGSQIYYIPKMGIKNIIEVRRKIKNFLKENATKYDIIHCHVLNMGAFYLYYAKKYGIKTRILHSHATKYADKFINNIRNMIFSVFSKKFANTYFACSKLAGDFMFKNKKYTIISNSIDVEKFTFNLSNRVKIREQEKIEDNEILLINVARFAPQKNLFFLIDIFNEILKKSDKYKLLLIGSGPLEEKIREKIKTYGIEKNIIMKKNITNVNEYMHASDLFVLPSLYEGLPVVGVEAQCADLPCIFSNEVTEEAKILETTNFLSIDNKEIWIEEILKQKNKERKSRISEMIEKGYKIEEATIKLEKIYNDLVNLEE